MKKTGLLNQPLSAAIAGLGHTDALIIADAGLPIPAGPQRIDLALCAGIPSFLDTLCAVLGEMQVERVVIAGEMLAASPALHAQILALFGDTSVETVPHTRFKQMTAEARAVVRTGEFTPYANVILFSGVVF